MRSKGYQYSYCLQSATGAKLSSQSVPSYWLYPCTTNQALFLTTVTISTNFIFEHPFGTNDWRIQWSWHKTQSGSVKIILVNMFYVKEKRKEWTKVFINRSSSLNPFRYVPNDLIRMKKILIFISSKIIIIACTSLSTSSDELACTLVSAPLACTLVPAPLACIMVLSKLLTSYSSWFSLVWIVVLPKPLTWLSFGGPLGTGPPPFIFNFSPRSLILSKFPSIYRWGFWWRTWFL